MIHSGSRGLGHQVATDALVKMEQAMARDKIGVNDRQLACARIQSAEGQVCALCAVLVPCGGSTPSCRSTHQRRRLFKIVGLLERHGGCRELCVGESVEYDIPHSPSFRKNVQLYSR